MTAEAKKVLHDALTLSNEDQRSIAEALLSSAPPEPADEVEAAWLEEARERAVRLERGDVEALDGDDTLAALEAKYRRKSENLSLSDSC